MDPLFPDRQTLLPDRLRAAWRAVEAGSLDAREWTAREEEELGVYRGLWRSALLLEGEVELPRSLLSEVAAFTGCGVGDAESRCRRAVEVMAEQWRAEVDAQSRESVESYYDLSESYIYDLMWWHTLEYDTSPLAYVTALEFGAARGCRRYLDFGSGVGAGAILFGRHGFEVGLADISSTLLAFSRWRLARRQQRARFFDLKQDKLSNSAFDLITAMDVFEHLVDPVAAVDQLQQALVPGGYLFGRFHADVDPSHPQHIVSDFSPTFARLRQHGFVEVWRDEWLWGHQIFQKPQ